MFELNHRMIDIYPGRVVSNEDIVEVVPLGILQADEQFFNYIYESNVSLGEQQIISLVKIQTFARNKSHNLGFF